MTERPHDSPALSFARSTRQLRARAQDNEEESDRQLRHQISFYKDKLGQAIDAKDKTQAGLFLEKLITLRGKQLGLALHALHKNGFPVSGVLGKKEVSIYSADCVALVRAVKSMLS